MRGAPTCWRKSSRRLTSIDRSGRISVILIVRFRSGFLTQGLFMKQGAILLLLAMGLMLGGCGNNQASVQKGASGIWLAELTGGTGEASGFSFITDFTINGNSTLTIESFQFLTTSGSGSECFPLNGG